MSERQPPRDFRERDEARPVEQERADTPARSDPDDIAATEETAEKTGYAPRHRAPGRAPLIRRRRNRPEDPDDVEVTWETSWREPEEKPERRWIENEESIFVEGDVRDEPESVARPWHARRAQPAVEETPSGEGDETADADTELEEIAAEAAAEVAPEESVPETVPEVGEELRSSPPGDDSEPPPPPELGAAASTPSVAVDDSQPSLEGLDDEADPDDIDDAPLGPRTAALQERKKKKKVRQTAGAVLAVAGVAAAIVGVGLLAKSVVDEPKEQVAVPLQEPAAAPEGGSTLFFGTREGAAADRGAIWMTLFHYDAENEKASIVYIPPHTAVEVPGRGLQGVGEAYGSGGIPLLLVATENLLGVSVDRYVELSDTDARVFFEGIGPITVDVPAEVRVPAGKDQARLIFVEGPQELTPDLLVRLLYTVGIDGDDVELGSRHLAFWDALFDQYEDPEEVAELFKDAGAALGESDVSPEDHASYFASIAELDPERLTITALPVRPISAGDSQLYATDEDELAEFVAATIGTGRDKPAEIRVQVLNGNGVPGIGQEVASRLVGEGFRVILSGNARRLNYKETLVIAYDSSEAGIALAERARELLGVGEVQVSAQEQGIVDLTIVVGKDFLRAR